MKSNSSIYLCFNTLWVCCSTALHMSDSSEQDTVEACNDISNDASDDDTAQLSDKQVIETQQTISNSL